jgi:hypothetical protein
MANELDELTGPILKVGNSNSNIASFFGPAEIAKVSKSFGTIGSAAVGKSTPIIMVAAANNNEPITSQELSLNKPLVKMINALASIDGFIKQRLDNQKTIEQNRTLSDRESQVEQQPSQEVQVIQQDAEKVGGSSAGLFALGGLALLTLDPVQAALKDVFDGVSSIGKFVSSMASAINGAFEFLLGGSSTAAAEAPQEQPQAPREGGVGTTPAAEPVQGTPPVPTPATPDAAPAAQESPSFMNSVASGVIAGGAIGMLGGRRGAAVGAAVGAVVGAYNYATGGSSSSAPADASEPAATGGATTSVSPSTTPSTTASPDATKTTGESGNVVEVNHPETGPGWGITGATDASGRPLAFSKEGAEGFAKMMQDSGGAVKPSDVASSKRSVAKNREVDGATNSPHLRGVAMDIHGTSEPWIRQHGHKYGWKPHDYAGTHGGHFVFGGPGLTPDEGSSSGVGSALAGVANAGLETVAKLFGALGSAIIKPGVPKTDIGATISQAAKETNAEIATAKTPEAPTPPPAPVPPRINRTPGGTTENPPTMADRNGVYYYLHRFGYHKLSKPEAALV